MISREEIKENLSKFKIKNVQFDLNGFCNSKCWYCPVKYLPQPSRQNMPIKYVEKILDNIIAEKGNIIDPNFVHIYTAHYNEIVLYPYFEDYLKLLSDRGIYTMVLTNGVGLTPKVTDIITKYKNIISGINFNIPAIEKNEWSKQTCFNIDKHDQLLTNIQYLIDSLPENVNNKTISVGMNGITNNSFFERGGWIEKLNKFPEITNNTLSEQEKLFKEKFPNLSIYTNSALLDRNGLMAENEIYSSKNGVEKFIKKSTNVIGCVTDRIYNWLTINSFGDLFLCCQDYNQTTKFGNIVDNKISDVWFSEKHIELLYKEINSGMCVDCIFAKWK